MILTGLSGPAGSGKDTAFSFIQEWAEENGRVAVRRGFADLLKQSAYRIFKPDCTVEEGIEWCNAMKFIGTLEAKTETGGTTQWSSQVDGRTFLQRFGTEAHRDVFDDDFWVDALLPEGWAEDGDPKWWKRFPGADLAVITDVRFPNEARAVKFIGQVWTIKRLGVDGINEHVSEAGLPENLAGVPITNSGTLEQFREQVRLACDCYLKPRLEEM